MRFAWQTYFGSEEDRRRTELDIRLQSFYLCTDNYGAFQDANWKPEFWAPIRSAIERYSEQRRCKVLEIGAMNLTNSERLALVLRHLVAKPSYVPRYVTHNLLYLAVAHRQPIDIALPWFAYAAIDFLAHYIDPRMTVFEYGTGGSTLFFATRCKAVVSVEDDEQWLEKWPRNFEQCDKWKLRARCWTEGGLARRSFRGSRNQGGGLAARTLRSSRPG